MVIDFLKNADRYAWADAGVERALRWLGSANCAELEPGRHELQQGSFAIVERYTPRPRELCRLEAHRRYIDVQFVARGLELIGYAPAAALDPEPYDDGRDVQLYRGAADFLLLRQGMFAVMLPADAHMPGVAPAEGAAPVTKVVVKVPVQGA